MRFVDDYIQEILRRLPNECAYIDYKQTPYFKRQYHDLIKDVIAMLNSEEAIGKDKAIIFGVVDGTRKLIGIDAVLENSIEKFDDANYQTIFDHIHPRPTIYAGTTIYRELTFGFVFIPADENTSWIYEVGKTKISKENSTINSSLEKYAVFQGQAFFRRGTKNYVMMREDRERILSICVQKAKLNVPYYSSVTGTTGKSIDSLTFAAVIGSWYEDNQNDRSIIEAVCNRDYESWIQPLRKLRESGDHSVLFSNNMWKVENSAEILKSAGIQLYDVHFEEIERQITNVFLDVDTKYDLDQDQRYAAGVYAKGPRYSYNARHGLSEFLAILGNFPEYFPSCSQWKPQKLIKDVIIQLFTVSDWRVIATMQDCFSLLAEADPNTFSRQVQANIKEPDNGINRYLSEKETIFSPLHYGYQLAHALAALACRREFFSNACYAIFMIAKYNHEFLNNLTAILLPWNPQTDAPVEQRIAVVKQFISEDCSLAWELLVSLFPGQTTISVPFDPPKYLSCNSCNLKKDNEVPQTYWVESSSYVELAIELVNGDTEKVMKLIDLLDDVPRDIFLKILKTVKDTSSAYDDEKKYPIWNKMLCLSCRHSQFSDADWALPEEAQKELDLTAKSIAPISRRVQMRRLFQENMTDILPIQYDDYQEEEKKLSSLRKAELKWCYDTYGLDELIRCIRDFDRTDYAGICLAEMDFTAECDREVCTWLSSHEAKLVQMAQSYIPIRFSVCNYTWAEELLTEQPQGVIVGFLSVLPVVPDTWTLANKLLGEKNIELYWAQISIWRLPEDSNAEIVVNKLLQYNRPIDAVELISHQHYVHHYLSPEIIYNALEAVLEHQSEICQHNSHSVKKMIEWLQQNWSDKEKLVQLEWQYLNILGADSFVIPQNLFNKISNNADFFIEVLCLAFKGHNEPKRDLTDEQMKIAKHCNRLLFQWKTVPGSDGKGHIDVDALNSWFMSVKTKSIAVDRYHVAMQFVGAVLFHSPADSDGLFIYCTAAEILHSEEDDSIRKGYADEAINSRGVHWVDPTGAPEFALEKQYEERATQIDALGLFRFADILRNIAKQYHWEAVSNIEEEKKWHEEEFHQ